MSTTPGYVTECRAQIDTAETVALVLDARVHGFGRAVEVSGIDARQLRNGLDRGVIQLGEKLEVGRWAFSHRDMLGLSVIHHLSTEAWLPVGKAAEIALLISPIMERFLEEFIELREEDAAEDGTRFAQGSQVLFTPRDGETVVAINVRSTGYHRNLAGRLRAKPWNAASVSLDAKRLIATYVTRFAGDLSPYPMIEL